MPRTPPAIPPAGAELDQESLAAWAVQLERREEALAAWEESLAARAGGPARRFLPAEPVAAALRRLQARGELDPDAATVARGFGFDPAWVGQLLDGTAADLDVDRVAQVCEALHCSPYDLWGPELGRAILDAYGPERWPRHIEPLDEPRGDSEFVARRLSQQADEIVRVVPGARGWPGGRLSQLERVSLVQRLGRDGPAAAADVVATLASGADEAFALAVASRQPPDALALLASSYELTPAQAAEELRRAGARLEDTLACLLVMTEDPATAVAAVRGRWRIGDVERLVATARSVAPAGVEVPPGLVQELSPTPPDGTPLQATPAGRSLGAQLLDEWAAMPTAGSQPGPLPRHLDVDPSPLPLLPT